MRLSTYGFFGAFASMVILSAPALADTFTGTYSETYNTAQSGLTIATQSLQASDAFDFALAPGDSVTVALYQIYTPEHDVGTDDLVAQPISTLFDFTGPNTASGSVTGTTAGMEDGFFGKSHQYGEVTWDGPSTIVFGDGSKLDISLNDTHFNEGYFGALDYGSFPYSGDAESNGSPISATFTLEKAPPISAAPEPAEWALMLLGVGMMGLALRRSTRQALA